MLTRFLSSLLVAKVFLIFIIF